VLTVRAGEVEVKDLGTRFLVSRQEEKTLVAVEEGVVEVKTPAGTREVRAGRAVTWRQGQLHELPWEVPEAATGAKAANAANAANAQGTAAAGGSGGALAGAAASPAGTTGALPAGEPLPTPDVVTDSIARLDEGDEGDLPPPPDEVATTTATPDRTPVTADEQWAALPPPPPKGTVTTAAPVPMVARKPMPRGFSLRELERRLYEVEQALTTPLVGEREAEVRAITRLADAKDCVHALDRAARWLKAPATASPQEPQRRRTVKVQQLRCLTHLGQVDEAAALQRELQAPP
jgi:hypothetical protein